MATDSTVLSALRSWAESRPDDPALTQGAIELTWAELHVAVQGLRERLAGVGVEPGDRLAILGLNSVEWIMAFLATLARGAVSVPLNHRLGPVELARQVEITTPTLVLTGRGFEGKVPSGARVAGLERDAANSIFDAPAARSADVAWQADAPAVISFTSGTTGPPKGATITYGGLHASAGAYIEAFETTASDSTLVMVPLFHNTGFVDQAVQMILVGGAVDVLPEFSVKGAAAALARRPATYLIAVPSIYYLLMHAAGADEAFAGCRTAAYGGSIMPPAWIEDLNERWPEIRLFNVYGLTEFTSVSHILGPRHLPELADSVGAPVPGVRHRIVGESGEILPPGGVGEIELAGKTRMLGYWENPGATASVLRDGWLRTGDLGSIDEEGFLRVRGRAGDVINRGGEKIHAAQVERALSEAPEIRAAAVVGAPHPVFQECVVACVEVCPGARFDTGQVNSWLAERVPDYALPERYLVLGELPLNAAGKPDRRRLRALAEHAVEDTTPNERNR